MASTEGFLPSVAPDFSTAKDFVSEADARIHTDHEPSSPVDTDNLPPELQGLEERLQEMRKAPRKAAETVPKEKTEEGEDEPLKALYFVRICRPDSDSPTFDLLQQEFDTQLAQVRIYAEHRRVQTLKKNEARKDTNRALACLKDANAAVNEQRKKLDPYIKQRTEDRNARAALKDSKKGLAATTERELDDIIRRLEFRMEHETVPLSEEKELHNEIKRLKASRPRVREFEQKNAAMGASMSNRDWSPSQKDHLQKELDEYRVEQKMYEKMYKDLREIERQIDEELKQICSQLDIAAKKKDAIYDKLFTARQRRRMRRNEWQRNKEFSRHVRDLVDEKRVEEAQAECMEQTNTLMSMLMSNPEYRDEYLSLWATKRTSPMAVFEDITDVKKKPAAVKTVKKNKSPLHGDLQILPGQSISEAVVADTLREATAKLHEKPAKVDKPVAKPAPAPVAEVAVPAKVEVKEKPVPVAAPKAKRAVVHDNFELPAVVAEKAKEPTVPSTKIKEAEKNEETSADAAAVERQKQERIEAQKKKKAEQAKKKKEKEDAMKEEKTEVKPREVVIKSPPVQPKKQPSHPKKPSSRPRGGDQLARKTAVPTARGMKRKPKSEVERITEFLSQHPILVASSIAVIAAAVIYALL